VGTAQALNANTSERHSPIYLLLTTTQATENRPATMSNTTLFTPITLGGKKNPLTLNHRIVMAPLARFRAGADGVQSEMAALYYSQRATDGGLIITEATDISPTAHGYYRAARVHSQAQVEAWKKVTEAVHAKNGKIFLQIVHTGRMSVVQHQHGHHDGTQDHNIGGS
jgi:2,4-dienoyl-CoA reductase-like NADH-dependent reductase (Old Yellow Enzyme family)